MELSVCYVPLPPPSRFFPGDIVFGANDRSESYGRYGTRR